MDPNGAIVPNAQVTVQQLDYGVARTATTDATGKWAVSSIPSGHVSVSVSRPGFRNTKTEGSYEADRPAELDSALQLSAATETVTVTASAAPLETMSSSVVFRKEKKPKQELQFQNVAPSANVTTFQRKVAGVLPVAVDVPRAGNSYSFVRPLVIELTFAYKT